MYLRTQHQIGLAVHQQRVPPIFCAKAWQVTRQRLPSQPYSAQ
jgi:hypothetical protein